MDFMTEMIMRVGARMPEETLLQELKKNIEVYQGSKDEKAKEKIFALCIMMVCNGAEKECDGGINAIIKETNDDQALADLLKPKGKKN